MENSFLSNKIVLKYCKDYFRIINEEFNELDLMSDKVIGVYQTFIFSIDVKNKQDIKKIVALNDSIVRYFEDWDFKKILTNYLMSLKVSKSETNVIRYVAEKIINEYEKYMEGFTRNFYISKWI